MELAGGSFIFLAFIIVFLAAVIYSTYSVRGSAINQRSYGKLHGGAPGAKGESRMSGRTAREVQNWSRGTR